MLQRLRDARAHADLTQAAVAHAMGLTQGEVSKCETGERLIDPVELSDFAALYGTSIDRLIPPSTLTPMRGEPRRRIAERPVPPAPKSKKK